MDINSCFVFINFLGAEKIPLIYYSHLVPVFFAIMLSLLVYLKSKRTVLSNIFVLFSGVFSLWLVLDLILWTSTNYYLIASSWAPINLIEIIFFVLALYFTTVFLIKKDINIYIKSIMFSILVIPFYFIIANKSILGFDHSVCEAIENNFLGQYKFYVELLILAVMTIVTIVNIIKYKKEIKKILTIIIPMFLFLLVFGVTEYLAMSTGIYEIHLYSLFIIPLFLISIAYGIFSLDVFNLKSLGTYFLVFGFIALMGIQFFFVSSLTNVILTVATIILSLLISFILFKNLKKETDQRIHIENLSKQLESSKMRLEETNFNRELANDKLKELDKAKSEFLSLASHQIRSPLTAINGYASMLLEGDYGEINDKAREIISRIFKSSHNLTKVVDDLLNVSKIEQGGMKYEMMAFDVSILVNEIIDDISINAKQKGLDLNFSYVPKDNYLVVADKEKIRQVILNLIDNSIKYTNFGSINIELKKVNENVVIYVKDTGIGMKEETKNNLFKKFIRGEGSKVNSSGSGIGLYLAKEIIEAHNGYIWAESDGVDKGSTFVVELKSI